MHDAITWLWPLCFGVMGVVVLVVQHVKKRGAHTALPIIQRRRELQEELNSLASQELATAILREASRQLRRANWDIKVLEVALSRAQSRPRKSEHGVKWTGCSDGRG